MYRSQRVVIDDKHIELVVAQMLRKVRVDDVGDTTLLPGVLIDRFEFRKINQKLQQCGRVTDPGDSEFHKDDIVPLETIAQVNEEIEASGGQPIATAKPRPASASTQLLGITKAAVQTKASCRQPVSRKRPRCSRRLPLPASPITCVGLKENVILGHLIPAGTGFKLHQKSEVRIRPEALAELTAERDRILAARPTCSTSQRFRPTVAWGVSSKFLRRRRYSFSDLKQRESMCRLSLLQFWLMCNGTEPGVRTN